jgi:PAS domain-containing protein
MVAPVPRRVVQFWPIALLFALAALLLGSTIADPDLRAHWGVGAHPYLLATVAATLGCLLLVISLWLRVRSVHLDELMTSEARNRALVTAIPDLIFVLDRSCVFRDYQAASVSELYAPPSEFIGRHVRDVLPPPVAEPIMSTIAEVKASGRLATCDYELPLSGALRGYEVRIVPLGANAYLGVVRDVTTSRQAERALRESEARYRLLFETTPIPIVEQDLSELKRFIDGLRSRGVHDLASHLETNAEDMRRAGSLVKAVAGNQSALDFFAVTSLEELNELLPALLAADPGGSFRRCLVALARGHHRTEDQARVLGAGGGERQIRLHLALDPSQAATWSRVVGSFVDLTPQLQTEQALRQSQEELEDKVIRRTRETAMVNLALHDEIAVRSATEAELRDALAEKQLLAVEVYGRVAQSLAEAVALIAAHAERASDPRAEEDLHELARHVDAVAASYRRPNSA